jgi:ankyrin repeat protein
LGYEAGLTPLHNAATSGNDAVVRLLSEFGVEIVAKTTIGEKSLYQAARQERKSLVQLLLETGVDINAKDKEVDFPPSGSLEPGRGGNALTGNEWADVNVKTNGGPTLLDLVDADENEPLVLFLVANSDLLMSVFGICRNSLGAG